MRQTRGTIPLYSAIYPEKIIRRFTFRQAQDAKQSGEFIAYHRGKGQMKELVALQMRMPLCDDKSSPCGITASESMVNAGLCGGSATKSLSPCQSVEMNGKEPSLRFQGEPGYTVVKVGKRFQVVHSEDFIHRTQEKVKFWPVLGDDKAVRIVPPNAFQVAEMLETSGHGSPA